MKKKLSPITAFLRIIFITHNFQNSIIYVTELLLFINYVLILKLFVFFFSVCKHDFEHTDEIINIIVVIGRTFRWLMHLEGFFF